MDYIYNTHVAVPESTIRDICTDLLRNTMNECSGEDMDIDERQLTLLGHKMHEIIESMCRSNRISIDGWHLDNNQVHEIANELHNHRKIGAIKAFRTATGAGLKESKHFIDSFCTGPRHEAGPLSAVVFQASFGK